MSEGTWTFTISSEMRMLMLAGLQHEIDTIKTSIRVAQGIISRNKEIENQDSQIVTSGVILYLNEQQIMHDDLTELYKRLWDQRPDAQPAHAQKEAARGARFEHGAQPIPGQGQG